MRRNKFKPARRFERLEDRQMMAADISLNSGVLEVDGTGDDENIVIETNPANTNQVLVTVTSFNDDGEIDETVQRAFARNQVTSIEVSADDGDDTVTNRTNIQSELHGDEGDDTLTGGTARDIIFGGDDDDTLQGGRGNDELHGGEDDDIYLFAGSLLGNDDVFEDDDEDNDEDVDTLDFTGFAGGGINLDLSLTTERVINAGDLTLQLSSSRGIENVIGTAFEDTIRGNSRDNNLRGEGLKDRIYGGEGDDTLIGGSGDDHMFGEGGFDRLEGGTGRDFLDGGVDGFADELVGNGDRDTFVLRKRRGSDPGPLEQSLVDYNSALDALIWGYY
jgi:Ca2+-binding RTX toxin-like protein